MSSLTSKCKKSIRAKILIPFVLIIVVAFLLGTFNFIHVMSGVLESNIDTQVHTLAQSVSERFRQQEQRIVFHAQNMAETKTLADRILNTNQVRILQIQQLQALRSEQIRFLGIYRNDVNPDDPIFPLIKAGLRGIRITALVPGMGPEGNTVYLAGVAPVPSDDQIREVVLLGTELNSAYMNDLTRRPGAEIVLFDSEGQAVAGSLEDLSTLQQAFSKGALLTIAAGESPLRSKQLETLEVGGTPFKSMTIPFIVNYESAGTIALMSPIQSFISTRRLLVAEAFIYASSTIIIMSILYLLIIRGITTPLKALEEASREMMRGKPVDAVVPASEDEVGALSRSFNQMVHALQTREKELVRKAQDFQNKKEELDSILQHMADGVVVQNKNYGIEYMNAAAVANFGHHVGEKCYEALHGRNTPCQPCSIEEILHNNEPLFQYTAEDRQGRSFEVISQPLRDGEDVTKIITLWRDVTERIRRFEEEKKIGQKIQEERLNAVRQVVVSIKHGINNSLTAIFGSLTLLKQDDQALSPENREVIKLLESGATNIRDTIVKLSKISDPVVTEYVDDISMIDLEKSSEPAQKMRHKPPTEP